MVTTAVTRRRDRYEMRTVLDQLLGERRCGWRAGIGEDGTTPGVIGPTVSVRVSDQSGAFYSGVRWCGSPWLCSMCSPKIAYRRGTAVDEMTEICHAKGGTVLLATFTQRHFAWDRCEPLVDTMATALGKMLRGRQWHGDSSPEAARKLEAGRTPNVGMRGRLGFIGQSRVMEISHGQSGWHPHIHAGLFFDRHLTSEEIADLLIWLYRRWNKHLIDTTGRGVTFEHGVDVRRWHKTTDSGNDTAGPGWYLTKVAQGWSLGSELHRGESKAAKGISLNPAQMLAAYTTSVKADGIGDPFLKAKLGELYAATKGRRMSYTSPKLREWCGLTEPEKTDEELAAEDDDINGDLVAMLTEDLFILARRAGAGARILDAAEIDGLDGIMGVFARLEIPIHLRFIGTGGWDNGDPNNGPIPLIDLHPTAPDYWTRHGTDVIDLPTGRASVPNRRQTEPADEPQEVLP